MTGRVRRRLTLAVVAAAALGSLPGWAQPGHTPELPRVTIDTTYAPASGRSHALKSGDNLQAALDAAQPGDEIVLEAGAVFTGTFTLPSKPAAGWVVVRSSALDRLPPPGTRVRPAHAGAMAAIVGPRTQAALQTRAGAHHFRFVGVEFRPQEGGYTKALIRVESPQEQDAATFPHDIIFDRCYIHGDPRVGGRRGIALNGGATAVIDSYVSDWKAQGEDSQALAGWSGPGPFKIVNNYLEGSGENVIFGGGDPAVPDLVPADIEIRRNHIAKPLAWNLHQHSAYAGRRWTVKNLFELKNARRVIVDGNLLEHSWVESQQGYAVLLTPRNQDGTAPWSGVEDVTFTNNVVRGTKAGMSLLGWDNEKNSQQLKRVLVKNNLFYDIGGKQWGGDNAGIWLLMGDATSDVVVEHNTALQTDHIISTDGRPHTGFVFRNNVTPHNEYGIKGDGQSSGHASLARYFVGALVQKNVLIGASPANYPKANFFPSSLKEVGFVDAARHDYALGVRSPFRRAASDGTDPGVDVPALLAAGGLKALP